MKPIGPDSTYTVKLHQHATLRFPTFEAHFQTVAEAIKELERLPQHEREHVVLSLESSQVFQPAEIKNLKLV